MNKYCHTLSKLLGILVLINLSCAKQTCTNVLACQNDNLYDYNLCQCGCYSKYFKFAHAFK